MNTAYLCQIIQPAFAAKPNDLDAARDVQRYILEAINHNEAADLVVLPEYANTCGVNQPALLKALAEDQDFLTALSGIALRRQSHVLFTGVVLEDGNLFNRSILLGREGKALGHYNKMHLTIEERETMQLSHGAEPVVFDSDMGKLASTICYDLYYPELFAIYRRAGVQWLAAPSYQRAEPRDNLIAQCRIRAMDSAAMLIRSSYYYNDSEATCGCSGIYAPDGSIVADVRGVGTVTHAVDISDEKIEHYRRLVCGGQRDLT